MKLWRRLAAAMVVMIACASPLVVAEAPRAAAVQLNPDQAFVYTAYHDFLGRSPSAAEEAGALAYPLGTPAQRGVIVGSLSTSPEWISFTVNRLYQDTLGRDPDDAGLAYWTQILQSGQLTVAQVAASFYSSPEYFAGFGNSNLTTWVLDLYDKVLLRPGSSDMGGVNYWVATAQTSGRWAVAYAFYQSPESAHTRVRLLYQDLLRRVPEQGGWDYWAAQVTQSGDLVLASQLAMSDEYYANATANYSTANLLSSAVSVTTAGKATCAVAASKGYCWGLNGQGVAAVNTGSSPVETPRQLPLVGVTSVVTDASTTCAVAAGKGYCWGSDAFGQVGNGPALVGSPVYTPYQLPLTNVQQIAVGDRTVCAVANSKAYCWGHNDWGQANPYSSDTKITEPHDVGISNVTAVSTDVGTTCVVGATNVFCWGRNNMGQVGYDSGGAKVASPQLVSGVTGVSRVTVKDVRACASGGGSLYCWGSNSTGEVGNGLNTMTAAPYHLPLAGVTDFSLSNQHSCAVAGGKGYCWGNNFYGQVGNAHDNQVVRSPFQLPLSGVTQVVAGGQSTCAVASSVGYCWGENSAGNLGNGKASGHLTSPVALPLSGVASIGHDGSTACAVAAGNVYCWGRNDKRQVGVIDRFSSSTVLRPVRV